MTGSRLCKRCASGGRDTDADLTAYWGDPLCSDCAHAVAALLDERDAWPAVPWDDTDRELLGTIHHDDGGPNA